MHETLAFVVLAAMSPSPGFIVVSLLPVVLFIVAFLLFRPGTRAQRMLMNPRGRRFLYTGLAVIYLLIGLYNWFAGQSLLSVALPAALVILCLAIAVRQKVARTP